MKSAQYAVEIELNTVRYRTWSVTALTAGARMDEALETPVSGDALANRLRAPVRALARRTAIIRTLTEQEPTT